MVRRKLVFVGEKPYWSNKEIPKESTGKKIGKKVWKGLAAVGKVAVGAGKIIGKEVGKAADNYSANQKMQKQMPQQNKKKDEEMQPRNPSSMFPKSGFGF